MVLRKIIENGWPVTIVLVVSPLSESTFEEPIGTITNFSFSPYFYNTKSEINKIYITHIGNMGQYAEIIWI